MRPASSPVEGGAGPSVAFDRSGGSASKLALANERCLAGAGFWAIGYERDLPACTDLIARFAAGEPPR